MVGNGEVLLAIAIEIAHCYCPMTTKKLEVGGGAESAIAIAQ